MPKTFYTERDIIEMAQRGVTSLDVGEDVVLTDLARDEALKRGIQLVRTKSAQQAAPAAGEDSQAELIRRVKAAVMARLGEQVDSNTLDTVITRVVKGTK